MRMLLALFALILGLPLSEVAKATSQAEVVTAASVCGTSEASAVPRNRACQQLSRAAAAHPARQRGYVRAPSGTIALGRTASVLSDRPLE